MAHNFLLKGCTISGEFVHQRVSRVHRAKQNLSGCLFKDCREVETVMMRWLNFRQQIIKISSHDMKYPLCDGNSVKELCDSRVNKSELF